MNLATGVNGGGAADAAENAADDLYTSTDTVTQHADGSVSISTNANGADLAMGAELDSETQFNTEMTDAQRAEREPAHEEAPPSGPETPPGKPAGPDTEPAPPTDTTPSEACSFSADTPVATPGGEQPIGSLQVGDTVDAYNPATGQAEAEPVQHVWVNHDSDLVDVRVSASTTTTRPQPSGHGWVVGDSARQAVHLTRNQETANGATGETNHTTANHPWLTADHGWVLAGDLRVGERVVRLDGTTATVVKLAVRPGVANYYNLTVSQMHTYAVGVGQFVVHNCAPVVGNPSAIADNLDDNTYFHYTNKEGYEGIMNDRGATLIPDAKNRVFAAQDIYSPAEAEQNLFLGDPRYAGKGDYVIVFDAPEGANFVPGVQANEFVNYGTVRVPTSNILYAGRNPW